MTGGITRSICGAYDDIMDEMGLSVSGIRASFLLSRTPDVCSITVAVDDIPILRDDTETDGWSYDSEENYLLFWGASVPARGSTILVTYQAGDGSTDEICEEEE